MPSGYTWVFCGYFPPIPNTSTVVSYPMPDQILISAISDLRKQAFRKYRELFFGGLHQLSAFMILLIMMFPLSIYALPRDYAEERQVPIESYIVKETGSSKVLMSKDIDRQVSPASLTKILTCIMAIESGKLDQDVLITKESTMVEPSKAGFREGDKIKLLDLVKAAMVNSSNDAAFAIAIHLGGSVEGFVASMNYRAKMIGMKNSRFTNPAGFDKGIYAGNISTAGDLLALTEYAVRNPVFNEVARLERAVFMEQTTRRLYSLRTHNKLLDKYPYAVGIKTGYTTRAGRCLIGRAIKDHRDILLVMLNAKTDRWNVAADMFDSALCVERKEPIQIVHSSVPVVREHRGAGKMSNSSQRSKHALALAHSSKKSGKSAVALLNSSKKSVRNAVALSNSSKKSGKHALALSNSLRKSAKSAAALSHSGRKLDKRMLASSKSVRGKKKKVLLS